MSNTAHLDFYARVARSHSSHDAAAFFGRGYHGSSLREINFQARVSLYRVDNLIITLNDIGDRLWGSRSFGAKNNDPLEVFVFVSLLDRLFWLLWGARAKPLRWGRKLCS
jgi:hypothetical protein